MDSNERGKTPLCTQAFLSNLRWLYTLEEVAQPKKEIVCSRSFGVRVTQLSESEEAVSLYMRRAAEKLRRQRSYAGLVSVFINSSRFN